MAPEHIVISIVSNYVRSFKKLPAVDYTSLTGPTFLHKIQDAHSCFETRPFSLDPYGTLCFYFCTHMDGF